MARSKSAERRAVAPDVEVALYTTSDHSKPAAAPLTTSTYALFVVRAGEYDVYVGRNARGSWHPRVDVPLDRTRLWIVP